MTSPPPLPVPLALAVALAQQAPCQQIVAALPALDAPGQAALLGALASPLCAALPPSPDWLARLAKLAIAAAEGAGAELSEPLLALQMALLMGTSTCRDTQADGGPWRLRTFYYSAAPCLAQLQRLAAAQASRCLALTAAASEHSEQAAGLAAPLLHQLRAQQADMQALLASAGLHALQPRPAGCAGQEAPSPQAGLLSVRMSDNLFAGGTGCHMWDACYLLAEFLLSQPQLVAGRRCLEVGCGLGLVGTCLARLAPARVLLTDGDPQTLVNCLGNLAMNGVAAELATSWREALARQQAGPDGQVLACQLEWHEDVPGLADAADVILGSDVCYDPEAVPSLVRLLSQLLQPAAWGRQRCQQQRAAYIVTTLRQAATLQLWLSECQAAGLDVAPLPLGPDAAVAGVALVGVAALEQRATRYALHRVTPRAS